MMVRPHRIRVPLISGILSLAAVLAACQSSDKRIAPIPLDMQAHVSQTINPVLHDTIEEYAAFAEGTNPIGVSGYGVVAELNGTGSGDMDPKIHELLLNRLVTAGAGLYSQGEENIDPEKILNSNQVAAVEVRGLIPAFARKGTTFDLYVNALPNSGTTSLENGLLWTSELKVIGLTLDGNDTRTLAMGRGPVFIPAALNAVADQKTTPETARALRTGRILGGGVCAEDRPIRLQLYRPNNRLSKTIEIIINAHFPQREKVADALNDSIINIRIPDEYNDNPSEFVDLVRHLYLHSEEPGFNEKKAGEIIEALKQPDTPHRDLGLALQGLGRSVLLDYIAPNYTSPDPETRYWSARAGAFMRDVQGTTMLEEMMRDASNPLRHQALLTVVDAGRGRDTDRATLALMEMINSNNTDDRIMAYHALLSIRSRAVTTYSVGRKFLIDLIPSDGPSLIYVLDSTSPRIAFIGRPLSLPSGSLFISKDNLLTISADEPDADAGLLPSSPPLGPQALTAASLNKGAGTPAAKTVAKIKEPIMLYWRPPFGAKPVTLRSQASIPAVVARAAWIPNPLDRENYDPRAPFIGATYQRLTEMLAGMCADKTLEATFVSQRSPDLVISPTDLALSGRSEGSTQNKTPAPPAPTNAQEIGAPSDAGK